MFTDATYAKVKSQASATPPNPRAAQVLKTPRQGANRSGSGRPLGEFARGLEAEVTEDQETLQKIIDSVGRTHLDLKEKRPNSN